MKRICKSAVLTIVLLGLAGGVVAACGGGDENAGHDPMDGDGHDDHEGHDHDKPK